MSSYNEGIRTLVSAEVLEAHRRVRINAAGTVEYADADSAGSGTTMQTVLVSGDDVAVKPFNMPGTHTMVAAGVIAAGDRVYAAADGKVSAVASGPPIGIARNATTADMGWVEVEINARAMSGGLMLVTVAAGTDHEDTTTEAVMNGGSMLIPAGTLKAGMVIRVRAALKVTDNNSSDTLTSVLRLGAAALTGTAVISTGAVNSADNDVVYFDVEIVIRSIGASGKFAATGVYANGVVGTAAAFPFVLAETAIDTTVANYLAITSDWSVAHADNEVNLEVFNVRID